MKTTINDAGPRPRTHRAKQAWVRLFSPRRYSPFARLGGLGLVALALAAMAPAVRGQVNLMGVNSQRVSTTYYVGLFYDSSSAPQIISTDVNVLLPVPAMHCNAQPSR
jgi:hypothetical protein